MPKFEFKPPKVDWNRLENKRVLTPIEKASLDLMEYLIKKYDIKSYDDFTCPHHERLARALNLFM